VTATVATLTIMIGRRDEFVRLRDGREFIHALSL